MLLKIYLGTVIIAVISLLLVYFRMFLYRKEIKEVRKENPNKKRTEESYKKWVESGTKNFIENRKKYR